jgi:hypothetical protein
MMYVRELALTPYAPLLSCLLICDNHEFRRHHWVTNVLIHALVKDKMFRGLEKERYSC